MNKAKFEEMLSKRDKAVADANEELRENGLKYVLLCLQDVFEKNPKLESFAWNQGEHYNDQNYEFETRFDDLTINEVSLENDNPESWMLPCSKQIEAVLSEIVSKEDYETIFGDSTVTVYKDKIELEDWWE
jgi:hypothetical protein